MRSIINKKNIRYYNDYYNYFHNKKQSITNNNKRIIYHIDLKNINEIVQTDKKQNFTEINDRYKLDKDNVLFIKILNKKKEI